jgi:hypothetical protein
MIINEAFSSKDYNTGKGYGLSKNRFHVPRKQNSSFPYHDDDQYSIDAGETKVSDEALNAVGEKIINYKISDFLSRNSSDPFYFVSGNTKLIDCFHRIDKVLLEVEALGDSMSPIPLPQPMGTGYRSSGYIKNGSMKRTGTKRGYFSPPPVVSIEDGEIEEETEEIYGIKDFSKILNKRSGN